MKNFGGDKKYLYWGVTAFCVIAASILLYLLIADWKDVRAGLVKISEILSPFIWGMVIAYLLRPFLRFFHEHFTNAVSARLFPKKAHRAARFSRGLAVALSEISLLLIVILLLRLVLPQLVASIESIILNSGSYYDTIVGWGERFLNDYPQVEQLFVNLLGETSESAISWAQGTLMPRLTSLLTDITSGVVYVVRGIYYVVIGIIASVYILFNKEKVATGAKKLLYSVVSLPRAEKILSAVRFSDGIFMSFVSGKLLDSAIIGVLCYVCCLIMNMPYAILVSVIVGVTNVIPFFGPFIGAIPATFIILMNEPIKALEFVLFIILLQQFDGNILGPKILGGSTGINGFWVMFSIIVGAGMFGFAGMLLGVPVFVVIYTGLQRLLERSLKKSGLPTETASYSNLHHIDPETRQCVPSPPEPDAEGRRAARQAIRRKKRAGRQENDATTENEPTENEPTEKDDDTQR